MFFNMINYICKIDYMLLINKYYNVYKIENNFKNWMRPNYKYKILKLVVKHLYFKQYKIY